MSDKNKNIPLGRRGGASPGFTLVELSIVLVILGLLTASGLALGTSMVERAAYVDTGKQLAQLEESLRDYYVVNGRLPCPARWNTPQGDSAFGVEVADCRTAGVVSGTLGNNGARVGMIPVRTLGLPDSAAADKFGSRIIYAVTEDLTDATSFGGAAGAISIYGENDATPTQIQMAYALYSHGRDRKGAFGYNTAAVAVPCGASANKDVMNCTFSNASRYRDVPFNSGDQAAHFFDDLIRWAPKYHFMALDTSTTNLWVKRADNDNIYAVGADTATGNTFVGIGTGEPLIPLQVEGTVARGIHYQRTDARDARISVGDPTQQWSLSSGWATAGDFSIVQEAGTLPGAGNRIYIKRSDGFVGINTSNPQTRLHVEGDIRVSNGTYLRNNQLNLGAAGVNSLIIGHSTNSGRLDIRAGPLSRDGAYIDLNGRGAASNGRVGLIAATDDPSVNTHYFGRISSTGAVSWSAAIYGNGNMLIAGTYSPSDARHKRDIRPIDNALEKLLTLDGIYYRWNEKARVEDKESVHLGLLAQQVRKVFPEAVSQDEDGVLILNLPVLVPVVIEGMRELKAENDALKAAQAELRERHAALEGRLAALEGTGRAGVAPEDRQPWTLALLLAALLAGGVVVLALCQLRARR